MQISFITLNRFVEDRASTDEEYRKTLERKGKVTLAHGRRLSEEALLAKLRSLNLPMDQTEFLALSQRFFSAEAMARTIPGERKVEVKPDEEDWVWIAFTCLWERWLPERPSLEMIDDQVQAGYKVLAGRSWAEACRLWLAAWKGIWDIIENLHLESVEDFDVHFGLTNSVFNWVQDLVMELGNAGWKDPAFWRQRLALLESLRGRLRPDSRLLPSWKNDLAETYFDLGMPEKGEELYRQWLKEDPRCGWGWIHWSDRYFLFARNQEQDPARAESLLKRGLAVPGVKDQEYLLERLVRLYEETGRAEEARATRAKITALEQAQVPVVPESGRHPRSKGTLCRGEAGLPRGQVGCLLKPLRPPRPGSAGPPARIGRNDPCPCGSGKKWKRCCGGKKG